MSAAAVNERIRVREGVDGTIVVVAAWCRTCRQESSANERGECLFCGRVIVDEDRLSSKELRTMLDLQALGFTDGLAEGVHVVLPEEPHQAAKKLLASLGATYEVVPGEHPSHLRVVEPIADRRKSKWTRETMIPAGQEWARKHGRRPTAREARTDPTIPNPNRAAYVFGSWASYIEACGFERPVQGRHVPKDSSGQALTRPVPEETTARTDEQEPTALTPPSAPPDLRRAALAVLDALRVLVDTAFPEEPAA